MKRTQSSQSSSRALFACFFALSGLFALLGAGGCEAIVNGVVPGFGCVPGDSSCPPGKVCSATNECIAACPDVPCPNGMSCVASICVTPPPAPGMDAAIADTAAPPIVDATLPPADAKPDTRIVVADTGTDAPKHNGAIGDNCLLPADCTSTLCGDTSILPDGVIEAAGGPVCTETCCRSEDCPASYVCFGTGTGGNYCIKASLTPREEAGATLGVSRGGAACAGPDTCRSGVCIAGKCADACCTNNDCGDAGAICRRETVDGHQVHACGDPPASPVADNAFCGTNSASCASGLCIGEYCRPRCCGQASCQANPAFSAVPGALCDYATAQPTTEYLTGCYMKNELGAGTGSVGDTCTDNTDCKTDICLLGTTRMCTDVCCTDADCAGYATAKRCRPADSPNPHQLVCQP